MGIIYAAPSLPPITPHADWRGMSMTWRGWDGSEWIISDRSQGVVLKSGVRGLNMPPTKRHLSRSAALHGTRRRGWVSDEREVFWPIKVFNRENSSAWLEHERAFWNTIHPDKPGTWSVTQPGGGSTRTLEIVFDNDGGMSFDTDPSLTGWQAYDLYFAAEQPFWSGETLSGAWAASPPVDFIPPGGGPPFNISSGSTFAKAALSNPGDVPAWPVYTAVGPSTAANVGGVGIPFDIPDGKAVRVDTSPGPRSQTALFGDWVGGQVINTVDRTRDLSTIDFTPVEPGANKPLGISMTGGGQIIAEITPLYFRAW